MNHLLFPKQQQRFLLPLLVLAGISSLVLGNSTSGAATAATNLTSLQTLSLSEQEEAMDFVLDKVLMTHYETIGKDSLGNETAVLDMRAKLQEDLLHSDFAFGINRMLLKLFQDAHTRVWPSDEALQVYYYLEHDCLEWMKDDDDELSRILVSTCETAYARVGDRVLNLGGLTPNAIYAMLEETVPHENEYSLEGLYPPSSLVREDFLTYFGVLHKQEDEDSSSYFVDLVFEDGANGEWKEVAVPLILKEKVDDADGSSSSFVSYSIDEANGAATFTLDACIFNEVYMSTLNEFWALVKANPSIDTVVLDLRSNNGGAYTVAPAFLQHITADKDYVIFDNAQRKSDDFCAQEPDLCNIQLFGLLESIGIDATNNEQYIIPGPVLSGAAFGPLIGPPPDKLFSGELKVLTSGVTFSSAHMFAGVVQINQLGTLVGTPTGNTPSFWGNVIQFGVPHTDLTLHVGTARNILPGEQKAFYPDVIVPTTQQDVLMGRDPQMESAVGQPPSSPTPTAAAPSNAPTIREEDDSSSSSSFFRGFFLALLLGVASVFS